METILRSDGLEQLTYYGRPLYIYSQEQPLVLGKEAYHIQWATATVQDALAAPSVG